MYTSRRRCIIWYESLYHSGAKSRYTPEYQERVRFCSYTWSYIVNHSRNKIVRITYGVARENEEQIYRENMHYHTCRDIYKERQTYIYCNRNETIVDLRGIGPYSCSPGEKIIGNLKELE